MCRYSTVLRTHIYIYITSTAAKSPLEPSRRVPGGSSMKGIGRVQA